MPRVDRHDDPWSDERPARAYRRARRRCFEPGQGWSYSNTGYFLVRRLIEQTTGIDIERALKTLVLGAARHRERRSSRARAPICGEARGATRTISIRAGWRTAC